LKEEIVQKLLMSVKKEIYARALHCCSHSSTDWWTHEK